MCFFDFIEQENALPAFGKGSSQTSRAAGFIAHEQLHIVQVEEFRHVKPEHGTLTEEVTRKFQRQLRLPDTGRPEKQERAKRFAVGLQAKFAAFQRGRHAGNHMVLAVDLGGIPPGVPIVQLPHFEHWAFVFRQLSPGPVFRQSARLLTAIAESM